MWSAFDLILVSAQVLAASSAGVTNVAGAALAFPDECATTNCTLTLEAMFVDLPDASFYTRGFGALPGPTIRVKAGETLHVHFVNALANKDNGDDRPMNQIRQVSTFASCVCISSVKAAS